MFVRNVREVQPVAHKEPNPGVELREMITARDGAPNFALRVVDVQPGLSTPFHSHDWEHEVYVVKGTGKVRASDGSERALGAGDSVYVAPNEKHCFVADVDGPLQFVCVIPNLPARG